MEEQAYKRCISLTTAVVTLRLQRFTSLTTLDGGSLQAMYIAFYTRRYSKTTAMYIAIYILRSKPTTEVHRHLMTKLPSTPLKAPLGNDCVLEAFTATTAVTSGHVEHLCKVHIAHGEHIPEVFYTMPVCMDGIIVPAAKQDLAEVPRESVRHYPLQVIDAGFLVDLDAENFVWHHERGPEAVHLDLDEHAVRTPAEPALFLDRGLRVGLAAVRQGDKSKFLHAVRIPEPTRCYVTPLCVRPIYMDCYRPLHVFWITASDLYR